MGVPKTYPNQLKRLFLLILLVAVLSLVFHVNLSYYELFVEDNVVVDTGRLGPSSHLLGDVKVFGRSLNQHAVEMQRGRSRNLTELAKRLHQLEDRLLYSRNKPVVIAGDARADRQMPKALHSGSSTWVTNNAVVQGNWSLMLCADGWSCRQSVPDLSQKAGWIEELASVTWRPELLCRIANVAEKEMGHDVDICSSHNDVDAHVTKQSLVVRPGHRPQYIELVDETNKLQSYEGGEAVVWPLTGALLSFKDGHLLRLRMLLTSVLPLRLYIHPLVHVHSGMMTASKQVPLDDIMQTLSETYGLGTAARWWSALQSTLVTYMLQLENEAFQMHFTKSCQRCFQCFDLEVMCTSMKTCYVIQVSNGTIESQEDVESIKTLVTFEDRVAEDVIQWFEHYRACPDQQFPDCEGLYKDGDYFTDDLLIYLLDWRREMKTSSTWISIYPGVPISATSGHLGPQIPWQSSYTCMYDGLLSDIASYYTSVDSSNTQELQYIAEEVETSVDAYTDQDFHCTYDEDDYGKLDTILTSPKFVVAQVSETYYNMTVDYHTILLRVKAVPRCCSCEVRLENKYNNPGARNLLLGLGNTVLRMYIVRSSDDVTPLAIVTLNITRLGRQQHSSDITDEKSCAFKQACSMVFDHTAACGLTEGSTVTSKPRCESGDVPGEWTVPCVSCQNEESCDWSRAHWQPAHCAYINYTPDRLKNCLHGKKLLFIGDSTNRGVANYIIEQINGTLYDWDKTHSMKVYHNVNENNTQFMFAYYPHFWLPVNHRPTFKKVLYQLIKSSLPVENSSKTILVVGGVQWLAKQHIDLIIEALQRKGLSGVTKVVKGLGAGFHQPVEGLRYVPAASQNSLLHQEQDLLQYAKLHGFQTTATFNMTISRYKDFLEGNCACHFHKVTRVKPHDDRHRNQFTVQGEINQVYSQILLNQIC